jgi:hypothetical protein
MTLSDHDRPRNPEISFAAWQWLTGSQPTAIRTPPVIAVVETLLRILTDSDSTDEEVRTALRRAVRLLGSFVTDRLR